MSKSTITYGKRSISYRGAVFVSSEKHPNFHRLWSELGDPPRGTSEIGHLIDAVESALASKNEKPSIEDYFGTNAIRDGRFLNNIGGGTEEERRDRIVFLVGEYVSQGAQQHNVIASSDPVAQEPKKRKLRSRLQDTSQYDVE